MTITLLLMWILAATTPEADSVERLDLSGWVSIALGNSPAVTSAEASVLSARASLTGDRAFLWPSLTATAAASKTWSDMLTPDGDVSSTEMNSYSAGLNLSQELLRSGGQSWLYMDASELRLSAAEADLEGTELDVVYSVANAYYDVLEAMELRRAATDAHERSLSQLERTEALYSMGAVTTLELLQIQVQESTDRLTAGRREQALITSYGDLYTSAGIQRSDGNYEINPEAVVEPLSLESVESIPTDFSMNPSIRAARLRARASEIMSAAADRSYWPSLRASAGWNWNDNTLDELDRIFDTDSYNVGLSLSWTIFDGFARESGINSARASVLSSQASLTTLENSTRSAVESLKGNLRIDIQYYHDSMLALEQASEQYRLSVMSYDMGALSLLDLLDAQSDLSRAEANLVSARVAALRTEAGLMVQLGRMPRVGE